MAVDVLSLNDLLKDETTKREEIETLLFSFVSKRHDSSEEAHDVEFFLHTKAIQFEIMSLSRTYLAMTQYRQTYILGGYFSISPKPLVIPKRNFSKLSKQLQKSLMGFGHKTSQENYQIPGYLIGQVGKNFSPDAIACKNVSGALLMDLAMKKVLEAHALMGGRIVYLECEDSPKLKEFYVSQGFREIEGFTSTNGLQIMLKRLQ